MSRFVTHIRPPSGFTLGIKELWEYRELFYFFSWRDIRVKYKQTVLGIAWALIQPLGMMLIFTLLFKRIWFIDTSPTNYSVFVLSGLIIWNMFNQSVTHAGESMIRNAGIINKIYFPRLIVPCASVLVALFDFLMGSLVFVVFCIIYQQPVHINSLFFIPAALLVLLICSFGAGTFLAAFSVKFRDARYALPFIMQLLFFGSQVFYPLKALHASGWTPILSVNPVNAAIELFRCGLSGEQPDPVIVVTGTCTAVMMAFIGLFYFRKTEAFFADLN